MQNNKKSASAATESTLKESLSSNYHSKKTLVNQDDFEESKEVFADLTEEDPVEPESPKEVKGKYWCFVLYPESAPENWREVLNRSGLAWAVSPLHECDLNADGSKKKAHYHVIVVWLASTTYNAVKKFTHETLSATVPQVLHSPLGYYRYFTHQDNPEKYQYSADGIEAGNGFDIADYAKLTKQQKLEMHMKISKMILEKRIGRYDQAVEMCMCLGFDEYEMLTSHTIHFTNLCKSVQYGVRMDFERSE